ncbi:hypothetical protein HYW67_01140 [Candidatus Parcubacteria bacterium]|nr:hypothetical protein [Candidatus Parcubacteria bacterium]
MRIPSSWRERLFLNLVVLTLMAVVAALVLVVSWLASIGVPAPLPHVLLAAGAVGILRLLFVPAVVAKFRIWAS